MMRANWFDRYVFVLYEGIGIRYIIEPLTANGSPGGSPSHTLTKTSEDFLKLA